MRKILGNYQESLPKFPPIPLNWFYEILEKRSLENPVKMSIFSRISVDRFSMKKFAGFAQNFHRVLPRTREFVVNISGELLAFLRTFVTNSGEFLITNSKEFFAAESKEFVLTNSTKISDNKFWRIISNSNQFWKITRENADQLYYIYYFVN